MAPRKGKIQGKQTNIKINSNANKQKRGAKKIKNDENPLDKTKWLAKVSRENMVKQCDIIPTWLDSCIYKQEASPSSYTTNSSEIQDYDKDVRKDTPTSVSEVSYECRCTNSKFQCKNHDSGMEQTPSEGVLSKYIQSGMNQVASFIVESAIRFGKEHGIVVPDKTTPNLYEITTPDFSLNNKYRKIRFRIPEESLEYEDAKKLMWKSLKKKESKNLSNSDEACSSEESVTESLEDMLPLLEKLKHSSEVVIGDLDLDKLSKEAESNERPKKRDKLRERIRRLRQRYKSAGATSNDKAQVKMNKSIWKKFKCDSLELGRQRLTTSKKKEANISTTVSSSPSLYPY